MESWKPIEAGVYRCTATLSPQYYTVTKNQVFADYKIALIIVFLFSLVSDVFAQTFDRTISIPILKVQMIKQRAN